MIYLEQIHASLLLVAIAMTLGSILCIYVQKFQNYMITVHQCNRQIGSLADDLP